MRGRGRIQQDGQGGVGNQVEVEVGISGIVQCPVRNGLLEIEQGIASVQGERFSCCKEIRLPPGEHLE